MVTNNVQLLLYISYELSVLVQQIIKKYWYNSQIPETTICLRLSLLSFLQQRTLVQK